MSPGRRIVRVEDVEHLPEEIPELFRQPELLADAKIEVLLVVPRRELRGSGRALITKRLVTL